MMVSVDKQFEEAASQWDLSRLYKDLALSKGDSLTPVEKMHLRGLLCGQSPQNIAHQLGKSCKGVRVELSRTVYPYIRNTLHREEVRNWRDIPVYLEEAGYKVAITLWGIPFGLQVKMVSVSQVNQEETCFEFNVRVVTSRR